VVESKPLTSERYAQIVAHHEAGAHAVATLADVNVLLAALASCDTEIRGLRELLDAERAAHTETRRMRDAVTDAEVNAQMRSHDEQMDALLARAEVAVRERDEALCALEASRSMTAEQSAAACARLVERGLITPEQATGAAAAIRERDEERAAHEKTRALLDEARVFFGGAAPSWSRDQISAMDPPAWRARMEQYRALMQEWIDEATSERDAALARAIRAEAIASGLREAAERMHSDAEIAAAARWLHEHSGEPSAESHVALAKASGWPGLATAHTPSARESAESTAEPSWSADMRAAAAWWSRR